MRESSVSSFRAVEGQKERPRRRNVREARSGYLATRQAGRRPSQPTTSTVTSTSPACERSRELFHLPGRWNSFIPVARMHASLHPLPVWSRGHVTMSSSHLSFALGKGDRNETASRERG